jgi:hypothetical protein
MLLRFYLLAAIPHPLFSCPKGCTRRVNGRPFAAFELGGYILSYLIFVGAMDDWTNIDAVQFFSLEVFSKIWQSYQDATLVTGCVP